MTDLWSKTEEIWEGVFSIIACIIIYVMGVAFLKMDRSRVKWRLKLAAAFEKSQNSAIAHHAMEDGQLKGDDVKEGRQGKWALFLLPFITVMREGLEAVVFVGGVGCLYLPGLHLLTSSRYRSTPRPPLYPSPSSAVSLRAP